MKFEYVGFKAQISHQGVSFKKGKDDKYIYFPFVYELIESINHNYESNKNHSSNIKIDYSNIDKLYNKVENYYPNLENDINKKLEEFKLKLEDEQEEIKINKFLNEFEKKAYITNLELMKDYKIRRAKNKIFYYYCIYLIANIIKDKKLKELDIPFNEKFWHVLKTLQGILSSEKINSDIKAIYNDSTLRLKLTTSL